jgi:hypothetical protein
MFFTITVEMPEGGYFEFATESFFQLAEIAQIMGNVDIVDEDEESVQYFDDEFCVADELEQYFEDGEYYTYDEDAECYCWYDEEYDAWYWLNEETGEWLLVEDEAEEEAEEE